MNLSVDDRAVLEATERCTATHYSSGVERTEALSRNAHEPCGNQPSYWIAFSSMLS